MKNIQKVNLVNFDIQITSYTASGFSPKGNPTHYEFVAFDKSGKEIWGSDVSVSRRQNYETGEYEWSTSYSSISGNLDFLRIKGTVLNFAYDFITKI